MTTRIAGPLTLVLAFLGLLSLDWSTSLTGRLTGHLFMLGCLFLYGWLLRREEGPGWGMVLVAVGTAIFAIVSNNVVPGYYLLACGLITAAYKFRRSKR